jgi:hypothetical protein
MSAAKQKKLRTIVLDQRSKHTACMQQVARQMHLLGPQTSQKMTK